MRSIVRFCRGREIELASAAAAFLIAAGVYFLAIQPMLVEHSQAQDRWARLHEARRKEHQLAGKRRRMAVSLAKVRSKLEDSPLQLESADNINARVARINTLAGACGAQLEDIRLAPIESFPRYATVPIFLAGRGNYSTIVGLLGRLSKSFPDTAVTSLHVSGTGAGESWQARFEIQLVWYATPGSTPLAVLNEQILEWQDE